MHIFWISGLVFSFLMLTLILLSKKTKISFYTFTSVCWLLFVFSLPFLCFFIAADSVHSGVVPLLPSRRSHHTSGVSLTENPILFKMLVIFWASLGVLIGYFILSQLARLKKKT